MNLPENLKYSKEHEWVKVDGNKAYIGITEFAQSELGDIVFVELPDDDEDIEQGSTFGSVESVKTVSDLYAPVTGQILEINEELEDSPESVNESPYDKGWMLLVELSDTSELDSLMSAQEYEDMVSED